MHKYNINVVSAIQDDTQFSPCSYFNFFSSFFFVIVAAPQNGKTYMYLFFPEDLLVFTHIKPAESRLLPC